VIGKAVFTGRVRWNSRPAFDRIVHNAHRINFTGHSLRRSRVTLGIQGLTTPVAQCKKLSASEAPDPGRHHIGTPGDIISECPGDFVRIRTSEVFHPLRTHKGRLSIRLVKGISQAGCRGA
jgi:hypothetical protein